MARPGASILLIHNTIGREGDLVINHVRANRDRYIDFAEAAQLPASGQTRLALSFDDGFVSNMSVARRLAEEGLSAVFYVPTDVVGLAKPDVDRFFRRPQREGVMTWKDLEELVSLGHIVGSHCREHLPLIDMSSDRAEDQVKGSIQALRTNLGEAEHFAWPFGALRYAPVPDVLKWCSELGVVAASGRRGLNTPTRFAAEGYLRRDAVQLHRIQHDLDVFLSNDARQPA